jgi:hypothetical protein
MKITVTITTENDAFDSDPSPEVARIFKRLANDMENLLEQPRPHQKKILDLNGNTVGYVVISP